MKLALDVIQLLVNSHGQYLLVRCEDFGGVSALIICPDVPGELQQECINACRLGVVLRFVETECKTNIPFGSSYPFQNGFRYGMFIDAEQLPTGLSPMALLFAANGEKDYFALLKMMRTLSSEPIIGE